MNFQIINTPDGVELLKAIRENRESIKASICDAFSNAVFIGERKTETWVVLETLHEFSHIVDALTDSINE